jgi:formamidopyrimidine-DNA glycosylase
MRLALLYTFLSMKQLCWVADALSVVSSRSSAFGRSLQIRQTKAQQQNRMYSKSRITMMPEGPEVKTVVDQLQGGVGMEYQGVQFLSGRYIRHGTPVGYDGFCETLAPEVDESDDNIEERDTIVEWNAKGKFIYIVLNDGKHELQQEEDDDDFKRSIWVTLGMSGRFVAESQQPRQTTQARWAIHLRNGKSGKTSKIFYHDPRNFGTLKFCLSAKALEAKLKTLGPDILQSNTTTEDVFVALVAAQKPELNVCKFLMNQKVRKAVCLPVSLLCSFSRSPFYTISAFMI